MTLRPFVEDVPFDVHGKIRAQLPPIGDLEYEKEFNVVSEDGDPKVEKFSYVNFSILQYN